MDRADGVGCLVFIYEYLLTRRVVSRENLYNWFGKGIGCCFVDMSRVFGVGDVKQWLYPIIYFLGGSPIRIFKPFTFFSFYIRYYPV